MKTKRVIRFACGAAAAAVLSACAGTGAGIEGRWTEPVPGMEDQVQGVSLEKGGKASSVNMATLKYESWKREGGALTLTGKSIGNRMTIPFTETFEIEKLTKDELILKDGARVLRFKRQ